MRALVEQMLSIVITKIPSNQDSRNIFLTRSKALQLMVAYYSNAISAQSNGSFQDQDLQHKAEKMAEVLLDSCL